jgi:hypothetical protein
MKKRLPKWNNDDAVAALVDAEFLEWERQDAMDAVDRLDPGFKESELLSWIENDAADAAKRGDFKPLIEIFEQQNLLIRHLTSKFGLSKKTLAIAAKKLRGEWIRNHGRPRQSDEERHAGSKCHGAAAELPDVIRILKSYYPNEKVREKAIEIAARRAGIKAGTLSNYLRSDRRLP